MATARKRPADALDDVEAECQFRIELPIAPEMIPGKKPVNKRRRTGSEGSPAPSQKEKKDGSLQTGPFAPLGRFLKDPDTNMDRRYKVEPAEVWGPMGKFNSFIRRWNLRKSCRGHQ